MATATTNVQQELASKSQNWYPTASQNGSLAKGKNFWVIPLTTEIPTLADYGNGFKNAGQALGASVTVFDGKATPTVIAQGINSAVAAHANAIVLGLIDPALVAPAIANAKAAGIPVMLGDSGPPFPPFASGVAAAAAQDQRLLGQWQMDYALKATGCKLHAMLITTQGNIAADASYGGFTSEMSKLCPTDCTSYEVNIQAQDVATKTQSTVQNEIQTHPDTNMVMMVADPYMPYVAKALSALGKNLPVTTSSSMGDLAGTGANTPIIADVVYPPGLAHGWFYMQGLLQVLAGKTDVSVVYPVGMVDASNRDSNDPSSYAGTSPYANYQQTFKQLWGVG